MNDRAKSLLAAQIIKPAVEDLSGPSHLPDELLRTARSRVSSLALFILLTSTIGVVVFLPFFKQILEASQIPAAGAFMMFAVLGCSLALFVLTRIQRISPQGLLDLALIYEVILAFGAGLTRHSVPWTEMIIRDWSEVAVWIVIFSALIPNTPGKTFLAAFIAGLMDPLGLMFSILYGNPVPEPNVLAQLFIPTFFAVFLSVFISRLVFRMGKEIHQANQMGSYRLIELIGQGGMGEVWLAEHKLLARPAAIKLISSNNFSSSPGTSDSFRSAVKRFEREAQATAKLGSEHTINLYDFGVTREGAFYYAMEYLEGLTIRELIDRFGPVPVERVIFILKQVCESLGEAHFDGLVHRDIKPANIFLCKKGLYYDHVKVLDFGLVRNIQSTDKSATHLTMAGNLTGTPAFMAPEVATDGQSVDSLADIYSLGCVGYWMLTGDLVFNEVSPLKMILAHIETQVIPPSKKSEFEIPKQFEDLILRCLEKDPGKRPRNVVEIFKILDSVEVSKPWNRERANQWWETHRPGSLEKG